MKIAILTFWNSFDNYGAVLQSYALFAYLKKLGHEPFLIRYVSDTDNRHLTCFQKGIYSLRHPLNALFIMLEKIISHRNNLVENEDRGFDDFRDNNILYSDTLYNGYKDLQKNPPLADIYIVGSDQVWNFDNACNRDLINAWFLKFVTKGTKISYAASFGRNYLFHDVRKVIAPLLRDFSFVTVRELSGKAICRKMGIQANVVCDPTLLLDRIEYYPLFNKVTVPVKKYVFLYLLSNKCSFSVKKLFDWCIKNNLDLIYVTGNGGQKKYDYAKEGVTIPEWLKYLTNADYVITNSFHGTVFSLLFQKKLAVIKLKGTYKKQNNRINDLFRNLHIKKTYLKNNSFDNLKKIEVQQIDNAFIEESQKFLKIMMELSSKK